jgi:hypothetical protein
VYRNIQSNKAGSTRSRKISSSTGNSISFKEDSIISIPPNTSKIISEYSINKSLIRNCDIRTYPRKKSETKSFTVDESPVVFSNRISYRSKGQLLTVDNSFFCLGNNKL